MSFPAAPGPSNSSHYAADPSLPSPGPSAGIPDGASMLGQFLRFQVQVQPNLPLGITMGTSGNGDCVVRESRNSQIIVGDVLESVNGRTLSGLPLEHRVQLLQGQAGLRNVLVLRKSSWPVAPPQAAAAAAAAIMANRRALQTVSTNAPSKATASLKKAPPSSSTATSKPLKPSNMKVIAVKKKKPSKAGPGLVSSPPLHLLNNPPDPGTLDRSGEWYSTRNNETLGDVADRLGLDDDWKLLALQPSNKARFSQPRAPLKRSTRFQPYTLIKLPAAGCSQWKLKKLVAKETVETSNTLAICNKCQKPEVPNQDILLCDGCDAACHLACAGLTKVPSGDWLCESCCDILEARRTLAPDTLEAKLRKSIIPNLPPMPGKWKDLFSTFVSAQKQKALQDLEQNQKLLYQALQDRLDILEEQRDPLETVYHFKRSNYYAGQNQILEEHGLRGYDLNSYIMLANGNKISERQERVGWYSQGRHTQRWENARRNVLACDRAINSRLRSEKLQMDKAKQDFDAVNEQFQEALAEDRGWNTGCEEERRQVLLRFAPLLEDPKYDFESKPDYLKRSTGTQPGLLGFITPHDELELQTLHLLCEPIELILPIPVNFISSASSSQAAQEQQNRLCPKEEYAIFAIGDLLAADRDDILPMDFSAASIRSAQRRLFQLLSRDPRHQASVISVPEVPSSVHLRGTEDADYDAGACFDLSELVRDCNCPLDKTMASTPKRLADHGLVLRDYQRASLQWMLDKEKSSSSAIGVAGELWHRMQFLDGSGEYFFCELTGSFRRNIFDYSLDVDQKDAAQPFGSFPAGGILGEEMGLGKTIICLSLVVANPPPKQHRVLPREHLATIEHPSYSKPPCVLNATASTAKTKFLSNGSLVVAPMTLCSQWQTEIEKFAPFLSVLTLHNNEKPTVQEIASTDIVVVSTFALQSAGANDILNKLKRVHFHRIFLDESHYNQSGVKTKNSLAALSATYRYCVTGTPVGHSLDDLYGQIRFLRIPLFCREDFWRQNIGTPYCNRNYDALKVLRALLSRLVVRHSKQQTLEDGKAMLTLPPRSVETLLLPFGSDAERKIYDALEKRNRDRFMELRTESPQTVLGKYMELTALVYAARQACGHMSMISMESMQNHNLTVERERDRKSGFKRNEKKTGGVKGKLTRKEILDLAVKNARPSAQIRMREAVLQYQDGLLELLECPICLEPTGEADIALTPCAHKFCSECIVSVLDAASVHREAKGNCPECREIVLRSELTFLGDAVEAGTQPSIEEPEEKKMAAVIDTEISGFHLKSSDICSAASQSSTPRVVTNRSTDKERRTQRAMCYTLDNVFLEKVEEASKCIGTKISRLLDEVKLMMHKDSTSKCVVFSQFLGTLDVASQEMSARGIRFVRVDGNMKQYQRADALHDFASDTNVRVFLLSMRAGAAGLNLMAADHCFILDAPLNTAIEEQAIDRIHRIGQTRPVVVKRFIIQGSVEERILSSRRALVADRPTVSTAIDGAGMEDSLARPAKRARHDDEDDLEGRRFQRLEMLESLFGCSATVRVSRG